MTQHEEALEIAILRYPGAQLAAAYGLADLFSVANRRVSEQASVKLPLLVVRHWQLSVDGSALECSFDSHPGVAARTAVVIAPPCLAQLPRPDAIQPVIDWLKDLHDQGAVLSSVCRGAFVLGHTGLLDGRRVTTHWQFARELELSFPAMRVEADRLVVDEGDVITAGGLMAWVDLGLVLVQRLLGPSAAAHTARYLVAEPNRESQSYFVSFQPGMAHGDEAVLKVQRWLQTRAFESVTLAQMAAHAHLGERTLLRRFSAATGFRPTEYVQQLRMEKARELLELTRRTVDQIGWDVGYRDAGAFRRVFRKLVGLKPLEYRDRFAMGTARRAAL